MVYHLKRIDDMAVKPKDRLTECGESILSIISIDGLDELDMVTCADCLKGRARRMKELASGAERRLKQLK